MKSNLRLNAPGLSINDSTPPFANTMLYAGLFFILQFLVVFFYFYAVFC